MTCQDGFFFFFIVFPPRMVGNTHPLSGCWLSEGVCSPPIFLDLPPASHSTAQVEGEEQEPQASRSEEQLDGYTLEEASHGS